MKISFTFRRMESSEALKQYTIDKVDKLERYEDREMTINVVFSIEKFLKTTEFHVAGSHGTFVCSETREDMLEAIDLAVDKLDRKLKRDKTKRKHHKGAQGSVPDSIG